MEETGRTGRYEKRVLFLTFLTFFFLLILSGTSTEAAQERDSQTQTSTSAQTQEELEQELLSEMDLAEIEQAVDGLRRRFGNGCVRRATLLRDTALTGFDPKADHIIHPVGYF